MQKLHYTIDINAPVQKVRDTMLSLEWYKKRTYAFNSAGSRFEGDRSKWSEMRFLWPDPKNLDSIGGILGKIAENNPLEIISIKYIGEIIDGKLNEDSHLNRWDASETYMFSEKDGVTTLNIELVTTDEFASYMNDMWPKALEDLKKNTEENA